MTDWPGDRWQATFRVVTPLFMGGADNQSSVALSPGGMKGVLRWWWRAVTWPQVWVKAADDESALRTLHEQEARLFGIAAGLSKDDVGSVVHQMGQGAVRLRVRWEGTAPKIVKQNAELKEVASRDMAGVRYLGYGLMEAFGSKKRDKKAGELQRSCFNSGGVILIDVLALPNMLSGGDRAGLVTAMKALGLLGGLGSRSRRGWGSLSLQSLEGPEVDNWSPPQTADAYKKAVSDLIRASGAINVLAEPPFSALSAHWQSKVGCAKEGWTDALKLMGDQLVLYRSFGKDGKVLGDEDAEKKFVADHDWYKQTPHKDVGEKFHPVRTVFGLPQNYSRYVSVGVSWGRKPVLGGRRASPLLLHVHQLGDGQYLPVASVFRSQFLPPGVEINANNRAVPANPDWKVIQQYLDRLKGTVITAKGSV